MECSFRHCLTWRMRRRWKKQALDTDVIWFFIESLESRRTPRSRTTSAGDMREVESKAMEKLVVSMLGLGWRSNQMSSVLEEFNLSRGSFPSSKSNDTA